MTPTTTLPRVTYTNLGEDLSGVHAHLDSVIPQVEARLLGRRHAGLVGARPQSEGEIVAPPSPIDRSLLLGEFPTASAATVQAAVDAARSAFADWRRRPWRERTERLRAGARALELRKYEVCAACLIEVGKSRLEAAGEVEEAIDLIDYYCGEMERADGFAEGRPPAVAGETSSVVLRPYGVFGVIAPFNFPVALSLGMITAALVAGNTVVFKPGVASGLTGAMLVEALREGGLPDGVLNLVFGGRQTGEALVAAADGIAFTGSNAVGMGILRAAAAGVAYRPVLAEMGGKNPTFVTASADLDLATEGLVRSAFGLQGQKCSAGSKVYVAREAYDGLMGRLAKRTAAVAVGDPRRREVFMGPVVNADVGVRFAAAMHDARRDGRVTVGGEILSGDVYDGGAYVTPTILEGLGPEHRLNRDELFLPVLSVLAFDDLNAAIADANRSDYGLTAGVYARDPAELDRFLGTIESGVLYANRASGATTGAWPGVQTFCGWKGSGISGKGGLGGWYVPQFMREQSRTLFA